jgi:dTDP-4-dehydrorhamnose reductase
MKIILTGSNGLLGQKVADLALQNEKIELHCFSKGDDRYKATTPNYHYYDIDLGNLGAVEELLKQIKPDAVIHSAAVTNVDFCENNQEICESINVSSPLAIAQYCAKNACHFTFLSTDFIFDGTKNDLYHEDDLPNPLSVYGKSKLDAEEGLAKIEGLSCSILRTCLVFGQAKALTRSNIALWAVGALKKGDALKIVNDQFRTPTLAEDLAAATLEFTLNKVQGIYNVSGPDYVSIIDLISTVAKVFGFSMDNVESLSSAELNQPANRPPKTGFDLSKTKSVINYSPRSLEEALRLLRNQLEA